MTDSTAPTHLVDVEHLAKSFGDHEVIKDISFTVDPGTVTCIIGPSGSGKTTLLRSLNGLEIPDRGVVRVGDVVVDFATVTPGARRRLPPAAARPPRPSRRPERHGVPGASPVPSHDGHRERHGGTGRRAG
jgi:energy-coupling factor transporter ATP-binding protein EcfA2